MKVRLFLFLVMFACAQNEHQLSREALRSKLSGYEGDLPNFGQGDIAGSLLELASDESEKRFYRERALFLLRGYPEERVVLFLSGWPTDTEPFLAVRALASLAVLSGKQEELAKRVHGMNYPTMGEEALHLLSLPLFGSHQNNKP